MTGKLSWLLLVYRVPTEPSRFRAAVWRRVKGLGAVYLQNSVVALPASPDNERSLRSLRSEILEMGGTAQVLASVAIAGEGDVVAALNRARDEEYAEVVGRCQDFLVEIETETAKEKFTYAELEEEDEDLTKLTAWLLKIKGRDSLRANGRSAAEAAVQQCVEAHAGFAERVYRAEDRPDA